MTENNALNSDSSAKRSMRTMRTGWLIFAAVMLFNPNVNLIDILPDFIGFFILAKFFEKASDSAPYFEEARSAFVKLGFISLAKIPALAIVVIIRSGNVIDNDIVALMALVFAVLELLYLIPAIKSLFDALSYLGERSEAKSLISSESLVSTDNLRSFTFAFSIMKCLLYTLPEFLKLTRSVEIGTTTSMITGSRYYPWAIAASVILGTVFGAFWLARVTKYIKKIKKEGKFFSSLENLADENSYTEYEKRVNVRRRNRIFLAFIISAVLSIDLTFSNLRDINLLPSFVFGIIFTVSTVLLCQTLKKGNNLSLYIAAVGTLFNVTAAIKYYFDIKFLTDFGYKELLDSKNDAALESYATIEWLAVIETVLYIAILVLFFIVMRRYTLENLGRFTPDSNPKIKNAYYAEIDRKTVILTVLGALVGIMSLVNVFVNGNVQLLYTDANDITMPTLVVSSLPWFGLLLTVIGLAYVFYSVYYFSFIKDEMDI